MKYYKTPCDQDNNGSFVPIHLASDGTAPVGSASCTSKRRASSFISLYVKYPSDFSTMLLPKYAEKTYKTENAGGSSVLSEAAAHMFFEHFTRVKSITLEMEIRYFFHGCSILDSILELTDGRVYGTSITRAMQFSDNERHIFTKEKALKLLTKKTRGLFSARNSSLVRFKKMILLIWCQNESFAKLLQELWFSNFAGTDDDGDHYNDIIVITPVCDTPWIYTDII